MTFSTPADIYNLGSKEELVRKVIGIVKRRLCSPPSSATYVRGLCGGFRDELND
jgi:hypothetical protein